jgi:hypothetical protein
MLLVEANESQNFEKKEEKIVTHFVTFLPPLSIGKLSVGYL